jgi:hypothetical protein
MVCQSLYFFDYVKTPNIDMSIENSNLEPKVAKLESDIAAVTRDLGSLTLTVRDLSNVVRVQGDRTAQQIEQLLVSVTNASAPKKTDWQALMAAAALILAIGTAALSPMYLRVNDIQQKSESVATELREHQKLAMHPVGAARVEIIDRTSIQTALENKEAIKALDLKLQRDTGLITETIKENMKNIQYELEEVKENGSPILRERLTILEEKCKNADPKK